MLFLKDVLNVTVAPSVTVTSVWSKPTTAPAEIDKGSGGATYLRTNKIYRGVTTLWVLNYHVWSYAYEGMIIS